MRRAHCAAFILLLAAAAQAQQRPAVEAKSVDRVVDATMRAWQIPGIAVAIVKNDRVVFLKGYGTKELGGSDPVTPDTLFQIASTSKAFTTTAIAMLDAEKKLSWDDPVREHVDYFRLSDPCVTSMVTLRDLVSHRTGVPANDTLWDDTPLTREDVVRSIGHLSMSRPFRTTYQYNNIMFIAAGEAVARASGMPWDDFVRTRIFKPLEMTRTVISDAEWNASTDRATAYRWDADAQRLVPQKPIDTTTIGAAGAIKSTARDLGNWIRFQLADGYFSGERIAPEAAIAATKKPHTVIALENASRESNPETHLLTYGLGWIIQDYRGHLLVSHSGSLNGFRTHLDLLPKQQAGFVVLLNAGRSRAALVLRNALADLLTGMPPRDWNAYYLMVEKSAVARGEEQQRERAARRQRDTKPTRPLANYAGTYTSRAYGEATVTHAGDALVLRWKQMTLPLEHWHFDTFHAESDEHFVDEMVVFDVDGDGEVKGFTLFGATFTRR